MATRTMGFQARRLEKGDWKRGQVPIVRSTLRAACGYWYLTPFPACEAPSGPLAAIGT